MGVRLTLAGGLAVLLATVAVTLSGSPSRVASTSSVALRGQVAVLHGPATVCQPEGALPRDITAVRMTLESVVGPPVLVVVSSGGRVLASGTRGSGWTDADVTVPIRYTTAADAANTTLCVTLGQGREQILMLGDTSSVTSAATGNGAKLIGRLRVEYLAAGRHSWWSMALPVARRLGLGRAPSGTWVVGLVIALIAAVAVLASRLALRDLGAGRVASSRQADATVMESTGLGASYRRALRRVPAAAWMCALIACLNAAAWSILSPPFQVPDEPAHFAYVQQLAEAHELPYKPPEGAEAFSPEEQTALADLRQGKVRFMPSAHTIATRAQQQKLEHDLAQPLSRRGSGFASTATSEPPLYYALETIPYVLGSSGTLLDRLELMRLFSCVFAGLTALFAFMFVRETLPRAPWSWTVGGLSVALAPLLAFISGGVNPEGMLVAVSAALFYLLARAFARGLTPTLAAAICAVMVVGVLTKLNALGLVPGVMLGLIVTARRASLGSHRVVNRAVAVTLVLVVGGLLLAIVLGSSSSEGSLSFISASVSSATQANPVLSELGYTWQLFLPRLPGMTNYFPGLFTARQLWFDGLVGLYGWGDTVFPSWVYDAALVPAGLIALLSLRAMVSGRVALGRRASELAVYVTIGAGVLALVGMASYTNDVVGTGGPYWEPRYLLPLFPLLAAALALAARGAGRRIGPLVGVAIVVLILGHDVFSQLLVAARYYG